MQYDSQKVKGTVGFLPGLINWKIEPAAWNLAGLSGLHCALETCWQRFGQFLNDDFLNDFLYENLNVLFENLYFLCENLRFSL